MCPIVVSVIIPAFNDTERLRLCLRALEGQTYPRDAYEVIVVDNGSDECFAPLLSEFRQARAYREDKRGSYAARNKGISVARGEIIAFTDSDCIPAADWIEQGVRQMQQIPNCGLVGGNIEIFFKDAERPTAVELYESITAFRQREYVTVRHFSATANLFTRRTVIDHVGPFNAEQKSGGDREFGNRVHAKGYELAYAQDVRVAHPARNSLPQVYKKAVRVAGGVYDLWSARQHKHSAPVDFARVLFQRTRWLIMDSVRALRDNRVPRLLDKLRVIAVMCFCLYAQTWEDLRLRVGGISRA